jgi:hypothetical protein
LPTLGYKIEQIEVMRVAYHKAADELQLNGLANATSETLALKILELVTGGQTDPDRICLQAVAALAAELQSKAAPVKHADSYPAISSAPISTLSGP